MSKIFVLIILFLSKHKYLVVCLLLASVASNLLDYLLVVQNHLFFAVTFCLGSARKYTIFLWEKKPNKTDKVVTGQIYPYHDNNKLVNDHANSISSFLNKSKFFFNLEQIRVLHLTTRRCCIYQSFSFLRVL